MKYKDTLDYEMLVKEFVSNTAKIKTIEDKEFINNQEPLDFLFISGGATRFIGLGAAAIRCLELGYQPQVYGGISAGSILTIPLIMGKYQEIHEFGLKVTPKELFKVPPINDKGNITWKAIWRMITSQYSLGLQDIKHLVRVVITPEVFKEYQDGNYPDAYVMAVNANTLSRKLWNLRDKSISYEKYLMILSASSRIPIMTQAEWIDGEPYFDGGMRNHTPSTKILQKYNQIGKVISIFAREKKLSLISEKWQKNVIEMIFRFIECLSMEISKRDEEMENLHSIIQQFQLKQIFLPNVLQSLYDTTPENLKKLEVKSIEVVNKTIGQFLN